MNKLNLNAYGVSEMNKKEMMEINGGLFWVGIILGVLISEALDRNATKDFWEGYNSVRK